MIELDLSVFATGVFAWLDKYPGQVAEKRVTALARKAHRTTLDEFGQGGVAGKREHALSQRFSQAYGSRVTQRSEPYVKRVRKFYGGRYLPFASPTRAGTNGGGHLRDKIRIPQAGYRVRIRNGTAVVHSVLTLPAARALNFHPQYRREFLALGTLNRPDGSAIERRVLELLTTALTTEISRVERRRIRQGAR